MISAIDHVQLAMPEGGEPDAVAFFVGVLGFDEEAKPPPLDERGGCWFAAGATRLHLGVEAGFQPQKKAHPAFLAVDLDALAAALMMAGYPVRWDEVLPERQRFYTDDPFGNRIEIMRSGDGFTQK
jgi:catechol 2,3-dioxygenase-like lactoylglutathione lyase family enzyme